MVDHKNTIPPLILSAAALVDPTSRSSSAADASVARPDEPSALAERLRMAIDTGFGGIMTLGDDRILAALRQMPSERKGLFSKARPPLQVLPIIPNVLGYVREATEYGLAGAGIRRLLRVGPLGFARAALVGAFHPMAVLRKDFPTLLTVLYELEMGEFKKFHPPAVFLHHQMTDLAISFDNRIIFETYARVMRRRFGTEPGLVTSNLERLGQKLIEWDIPISLIAAPLNKENFLMPGGMPAYQEILATERFQLIATRLSPLSPTPREIIRWAQNLPHVVAAVGEI